MRIPQFLVNVAKTISGGNPLAELETAMNGAGILDVGFLFAETQKVAEANRLARYATLRQAYEGDEKYSPDPNEGDMAVLANLNRPIANKSVDWLFGEPPEIVVPTGNEPLSEAIMETLELSNFPRRVFSFGQTGAVTGDGYIQVSVEDINDPASPIRFNYLKPQFVHPVFHPTQTDEMVGVLIQYPIMVAPSVAKRYSIPEGSSLYSIYITRDTYTEYYNATNGPTVPNPFGMIPVFHAPNLINAFRWFGDSDICDTYLLNTIREDAMTNIKTILEYHAEPTTIITGANAANLRKGAGKVWSTKNKDARVSLLEMTSDVTGLGTYVDMLKTALLELSNTPATSLGNEQSLTNTTFAALQVRYMSLLEKIRRKRITYGFSLRESFRLIAKILISRNPALLGKLKQPEKAMAMEIKFFNPLPRDLQETVEVESQKLREKLTSQHQAIKEVAKTKDISEVLLEVMADKRETLLTDTERARAVGGGVPNLMVAGLGSVGLHATDDAFLKRQAEMTMELQKKMNEINEKEEDRLKSKMEPVEQKPSPAKETAPEL